MTSLGVTIELPSELAAQLRGRSEWDDVIPLPAATDEPTASVSKQDNYDDGDTVSLSDQDLPQIRVDLKKLVGYLPSADATNNIRAALVETFEVQVEELLASGIAFHTTKAMEEDGAHYLILDYPYPVMHLWRRISRPHEVAVVERLRRHLANCHRPLDWKDVFYEEIQNMVRQEQEILMQRDLEQWKERRAVQLEKLYSVRETIVHRLETLQASCREMEERRERLVIRDLAAVSSQPQQSALGEIDFLTDDDISQIFGVDPESDHEDDYDDEFRLVSDSEGNHDHEDEEESLQSEDTASVDSVNKNMAAASVSRTQRRLVMNEDEVEKHQQQKDELQAKRELWEEKYTLPELRKQQAVVAGLKDRIDKVDELLEAIQEEEWKEEEEKENGSAALSEDEGAGEDSFSLLDQILAMILGKTTPPPSVPKDEYNQWLRHEHASIVSEWKAEFRRLPPSVALDGQRGPAAAAGTAHGNHEPTDDREVLKHSLGIVDNKEDTWEDLLAEEDNDGTRWCVAASST